MQSIAIVGGGVAGLGAAYALRDRGADVTLFERDDDLGGRAATRHREGCVYDYGANYLKDEDPLVTDLVTGALSDGLVDVAEPVWTFDEDGDVSPGRDADDHKWTYEDGIATLADRLRAAADPTVLTETTVESLERTADGWRIHATVETADAPAETVQRGAYDAVVVTPTAPNAADLLAASNWDHPDRERIREAVAAVPYRTIVSVALHYPFAVDPPFYALVNTDREHDVGWLSREECKPRHVPDGETLLVVQMAPDWSASRYGDGSDAVAGDAAEHAAALLDDDRLADPDWHDVGEWRHALPDDAVAADAVQRARENDLYVAGDWVAGDGRLHAALANGIETGERVSSDG
jgi:predicted NAD/FAD-dependent oxidoreductase